MDITYEQVQKAISSNEDLRLPGKFNPDLSLATKTDFNSLLIIYCRLFEYKIIESIKDKFYQQSEYGNLDEQKDAEKKLKKLNNQNYVAKLIYSRLEDKEIDIDIEFLENEINKYEY